MFKLLVLVLFTQSLSTNIFAAQDFFVLNKRVFFNNKILKGIDGHSFKRFSHFRGLNQQRKKSLVVDNAASDYFYDKNGFYYILYKGVREKEGYLLKFKKIQKIVKMNQIKNPSSLKAVYVKDDSNEVYYKDNYNLYRIENPSKKDTNSLITIVKKFKKNESKHFKNIKDITMVRYIDPKLGEAYKTSHDTKQKDLFKLINKHKKTDSLLEITVSPTSYFKDKKNIYFFEDKISGVDRKTFEVIDDLKAKDKKGALITGVREKNILKVCEQTKYYGLHRIPGFLVVAETKYPERYFKNVEVFDLSGKFVKSCNTGGKNLDNYQKCNKSFLSKLNNHYSKADLCRTVEGEYDSEKTKKRFKNVKYFYLNSKKKKSNFGYDDKSIYSDVGRSPFVKIDADKKSFKILNKYYALDKNFFYYAGNRGEYKKNSMGTINYMIKYFANVVVGVDSESALVLESNSKSDYRDKILVDKNKVYVEGKVLKGLNPDTLKVLSHSYLKDAKNLFCGKVKLEVQGLKSFQVLKGGYAKTDTQVFYRCNEIDGVDVRSFKVIKYSKAEDKNFSYNGFKKIKKDSSIEPKI